MRILGIDEVGRGPLAGPLVVGAVILPPQSRPWFDELDDSKKLSPKKRETLSSVILEEATTGLGWVTAKELDQIGISSALSLATRRAVEEIQSRHDAFSQIIIDGKVNFLKATNLEPYVTTCIKADSKFKEVSAASIIAKVARDHYMIKLAERYPEYGFDKHVGYGTKAHITAIHQYGLTDEHRKSFEPCKTLSGFIPTTRIKKDTSASGRRAEQATADYLESQGHTIIARNHKTHFYEIDIISTKSSRIYFTEVKYRANSAHGTGFDAITPDKLHRMHFAAESFLKYTDHAFANYDPILAVASITNDPNASVEWFTLSE